MKMKSGDIIITEESLHKSSLSSTSLNDLKLVRIRILAPSGDHFELGMAPTTTISELKTEIFKSWPKELLHEEKPESPECLKFLYQGRFQNDATHVKDLTLATEELITVHLFISALIQVEADKNDSASCINCCNIT